MANSNIQKALSVFKSDGFSGVMQHTKHYLKKKQTLKPKTDACKDILFINGCSRDILSQPPRYRITHQKEQLELNGYTCDEIYYQGIDMKYIKMYKTFIIFRCPMTEDLKSFIQKAKQFNKTVIFDIDDLVIDTSYTDLIPYVQTMESEKKAQYDNDVNLMKETLESCDFCITTTEKLKEKLEKYAPKAFINRNTASIEMVSLSQKALKEKKESTKVKIGYFSGSITHNADFEMIKNVLIQIMKQYSQTELHLVGNLDIPEEFKEIQDQVIVHPFMDYKELPSLIHSMDMNLAPLTESIFNEAKSEIKWIEASLVQVPTIASDFGAFKQCIQHNQTGLLCANEDEWYGALRLLILNKEVRKSLAMNAYTYCMEHCITMYTGHNLVQIIKENTSKDITFAISKMEISGGIMVCLKHASILQDHGYQVSFISLYDKIDSYTYLDHEFPIIPLDVEKLDCHFDKVVATMWPTVEMIKNIKNIRKRYYFVQNFETNFYDFDNPLKIEANKSYTPLEDFTFITISKWCQEWLKEKYGQDARYAPNGIDLQQFTSHKRTIGKKVRILIEGDSSAKHKNVDESFEIVNHLDKDKFEIWYMSYNAKPKDGYRVDKFMHKIPYEEVAKVYADCDILIKTSLLESFSYPPLEMMATGGYVVAILNDGNKEYLKDEDNCLIYEQGNIDEALNAIDRIVHDGYVQNTLYFNGLKTAKSRDWHTIENDILNLYED